MNDEDKARQIVADILDVDEAEVTEDFNAESTNHWSSLNHLRLVAALEEEFGIRLAMRDVRQMTSFAAICETIARVR